MGRFEAGMFTAIYLVPTLIAFPMGVHGGGDLLGLVFWYGIAASFVVWVLHARAKAATSLRGSRDRTILASLMALPPYAALMYIHG